MSYFPAFHRFVLSLALAIPAWLATTPLQSALAQVCCPAGCVQNGGGCQRAGLLGSCTPVTCGRPSQSPSPSQGASPGRGAPAFNAPRTALDLCQRLPGYMPPGSYRKTCNDMMFACSAKVDTLTAVCRSGQGLRKSTLPEASLCVDVRNDNGLLKCHKRIRRVV